MGTMAMAVLWLGGCLVPNTQYREPPPDQHVAMDLSSPVDLLVPPDLLPCPSYLPGGGGGMSRPEVRVTGGMGKIQGVTTKVADFYLDVFDVTVGAYRDFFTSTGQMAANTPSTGQDCNWTTNEGTKEDHPINCVTFAQAGAFCSWAGRRLPTEGEWAYAAYGAGDTATTYPWGPGAPQEGTAAQMCWGRYNGSACPDMGNCDLGTCVVGNYPKTLKGTTDCGGLADMAGNVYQWLNTQYNNQYALPDTTCSSECSLRGGSWRNDDPANFGAANRPYYEPGTSYDYIGIRCARTP